MCQDIRSYLRIQETLIQIDRLLFRHRMRIVFPNVPCGLWNYLPEELMIPDRHQIISKNGVGCRFLYRSSRESYSKMPTQGWQSLEMDCWKSFLEKN